MLSVPRIIRVTRRSLSALSAETSCGDLCHARLLCRTLQMRTRGGRSPLFGHRAGMCPLPIGSGTGAWCGAWARSCPLFRCTAGAWAWLAGLLRRGAGTGFRSFFHCRTGTGAGALLQCRAGTGRIQAGRRVAGEAFPLLRLLGGCVGSSCNGQHHDNDKQLFKH